MKIFRCMCWFLSKLWKETIQNHLVEKKVQVQTKLFCSCARVGWTLILKANPTMRVTGWTASSTAGVLGSTRLGTSTMGCGSTMSGMEKVPWNGWTGIKSMLASGRMEYRCLHWLTAVGSKTSYFAGWNFSHKWLYFFTVLSKDSIFDFFGLELSSHSHPYAEHHSLAMPIKRDVVW